MSAPNLHDMLARDKLAHELNEEAKKQLRAHLNSCESLTDEEKEERDIMNAKHAHAMEHEAIQKRSPPLVPPPVGSARARASRLGASFRLQLHRP